MEQYSVEYVLQSRSRDMSKHWEELEDIVKTTHEELGIHHRRIKTRITPYKGDNEIADFYSYYRGNLFYLEVKSTKGERFPFSMIQPNQLVGLYEASQFDGVHGLLIVGIKTNKEVYLVEIDTINDFLKKGKVSMNREELIKYGKEISYKSKNTLQIDSIYDIIR